MPELWGLTEEAIGMSDEDFLELDRPKQVILVLLKERSRFSDEPLTTEEIQELYNNSTYMFKTSDELLLAWNTLKKETIH